MNNINPISIKQIKDYYVRTQVAYITLEHNEKFLSFFYDGTFKLTERGSYYLDFMYDMFAIHLEFGEKADLTTVFWPLFTTVNILKYEGNDIKFMYEKYADFLNIGVKLRD
jgi:hypothetical protein